MKRINNVDRIINGKSIITIEKEWYDENGISMVKETLSRNGVIYFEETREVGGSNSPASLISGIDKWIECERNDHPEIYWANEMKYRKKWAKENIRKRLHNRVSLNMN